MGSSVELILYSILIKVGVSCIPVDKGGVSCILSSTGCAILDVPNGDVVYSSAQVVGSVATYSCDAVNGYVLSEAGTRTCAQSGWTGSDITCERKTQFMCLTCESTLSPFHW